MPILLHSCPAARTPSSSVLENFTSVNRWVTLQWNMLALGPRGGVTESSPMSQVLLHCLCAIISVVGPQYKKRYINRFMICPALCRGGVLRSLSRSLRKPLAGQCQSRWPSTRMNARPTHKPRLLSKYVPSLSSAFPPPYLRVPRGWGTKGRQWTQEKVVFLW